MSPQLEKVSLKSISRQKTRIKEKNVPSINIKNLDIHIIGSPSVETVQPTFKKLITVTPTIDSTESMNKNYLWKYKVGI